MPEIELYGSDQCPYTREIRDWLQWTRRKYREYNVDTDPEAYARAMAFSNGALAVPMLVEDNKVIQIGWEGRSCMIVAKRDTSSAPDRPASADV